MAKGGATHVSLTLKSGRVIKFRTDEWDEDVILERIAQQGDIVVDVQRQLCNTMDG